MKYYTKAVIKKFADGDRWNCQLWTKGGKKGVYMYCGNGKSFPTFAEAYKYGLENSDELYAEKPDAYNDQKTWHIRRYRSGHYAYNQSIAGKMHNTRYYRTSAKHIREVLEIC